MLYERKLLERIARGLSHAGEHHHHDHSHDHDGEEGTYGMAFGFRTVAQGDDLHLVGEPGREGHEGDCDDRADDETREKLADGDFDIFFLTGIGEVFPYIRSHNVLNNLQSVVAGSDVEGHDLERGATRLPLEEGWPRLAVGVDAPQDGVEVVAAGARGFWPLVVGDPGAEVEQTTEAR